MSTDAIYVAIITLAGVLGATWLANRHQRKVATSGRKLEAWATLAGILGMSGDLLARRADPRTALYKADLYRRVVKTHVQQDRLNRRVSACLDATHKADYEIIVLDRQLREATGRISRLWRDSRTRELIAAVFDSFPAEPKLPPPPDSAQELAARLADCQDRLRDYRETYACRRKAHQDTLGELVLHIERQLDKEAHCFLGRGWLAAKKRYLHFEQVVFFRSHPLP